MNHQLGNTAELGNALSTSTKLAGELAGRAKAKAPEVRAKAWKAEAKTHQKPDLMVDRLTALATKNTFANHLETLVTSAQCRKTRRSGWSWIPADGSKGSIAAATLADGTDDGFRPSRAGYIVTCG